VTSKRQGEQQTATADGDSSFRIPHSSFEVGGFGDILKPESVWVTAGFQLPDGSFWAYREPGAVVVAQKHRLRVTAMPLTRSNDRVQILDNAKHMYFSRERVLVPEGGALRVDVRISAQGHGTASGDLYDGFVSYNLLDFETGFAIDVFISNDVIATVYARLPFPGVPAPSTGDQRYFAIFKELDLPTRPGEPHDYRITYDQSDASVRWWVDGALVNEERNVPDRIRGFTLAMGLMTEKDIRDGKSVSLHGQGLTGEWSPTRVTLTQPGEEP
jgi:hypothetical protein